MFGVTQSRDSSASSGRPHADVGVLEDAVHGRHRAERRRPRRPEHRAARSVDEQPEVPPRVLDRMRAVARRHVDEGVAVMHAVEPPERRPRVHRPVRDVSEREVEGDDADDELCGRRQSGRLPCSAGDSERHDTAARPTAEGQHEGEQQRLDRHARGSPPDGRTRGRPGEERKRPASRSRDRRHHGEQEGDAGEEVAVRSCSS